MLFSIECVLKFSMFGNTQKKKSEIDKSAKEPTQYRTSQKS